MPTYYTNTLVEDDLNFQQFAMLCARSFGACIEMRDDPPDTPIPDEFKPSDYHLKRLKEAEERRDFLTSLSPEEITAWAIRERQKERKEEIEKAEKALAEKKKQEEKYRSMLALVKQWQPPTADHEGLKNFMIQQIEESIKSDCSGSYWYDRLAEVNKPTPPQVYYQEKLGEAERDCEYHRNGFREDEERARSRTKWVNDLRKSLEDWK